MEKSHNSNKSLELAITNSDLKNLTKEYGELAIDGILKDGILKDIPLLGTIIGAIKFGNSINQNIATKKLYKFLFQLNKIPLEKRKQKIEEINSSKKYQSKVGEQIFELLEKIESDGKPEIIGKLFAAVIQEKIDYIKFLKASHIVKTVFYYDLIALKKTYDGKYLNDPIDDTLMTNGLVQSNVDFVKSFEKGLNFDDDGNSKEPEEYKQEKDSLTDMGKLIVEIGMK